MVTDQGGLRAAKALLSSSGYSEGLTRLWEEKRLDISIGQRGVVGSSVKRVATWGRRQRGSDQRNCLIEQYSDSE